MEDRKGSQGRMEDGIGMWWMAPSLRWLLPQQPACLPQLGRDILEDFQAPGSTGPMPLPSSHSNETDIGHAAVKVSSRGQEKEMSNEHFLSYESFHPYLELSSLHRCRSSP